MFESMIDRVDAEKWEEQSTADKNESEFVEYHVMKNHNKLTCTSYQYLIADEEGEGMTVEIVDCKPEHDPLKSICVVELKLDDEKKLVIGIDLNGDIVVRKS